VTKAGCSIDLGTVRGMHYSVLYAAIHGRPAGPRENTSWKSGRSIPTLVVNVQ
jgi:hypothetical protein